MCWYQEVYYQPQWYPIIFFYNPYFCSISLHRLRADILPFHFAFMEMKEAIRLYLKKGFIEIAPYCISENDHPVFMEFDLENWSSNFKKYKCVYPFQLAGLIKSSALLIFFESWSSKNCVSPYTLWMAELIRLYFLFQYSGGIAIPVSTKTLSSELRQNWRKIMQVPSRRTHSFLQIGLVGSVIIHGFTLFFTLSQMSKAMWSSDLWN